MNDNRKLMNKKQVFLRFMRYVTVAVVTVILLFVFILSIGLDGFDLDLALFVFILIFSALFFITLPSAVFWIYSFIKAIKRRTKTDRILLWFHITDLLLLGMIIYLANQPPHKCDAFIMAECYNGEPVFWMWNTADHYRNMLPDSTRLVVELDNDEMPQSDILSEFEMKKLKERLDYLGCIGIDVNNYPNSEYSTIRFRRIGMGMYSFRLYHHPLTRQQQDSINANECLIVYNDSTVFEFGGGVFGPQVFVGKDEFLKSRNKNQSNSKQ